ncbi:MAG TPA: hypothetical protein VER04_09740 [Polyangiaceae bacterium]|nr:hypothetical protein [Polyangiaceae bacterium]
MDTDDTKMKASTRPPTRDSTKFGLGAFLAFLAGLLGLAAVILIWFGIFPGLVALGIGLPLALVGARLMRAGKPATTARD